MAVSWADLKIPESGFDVALFHAALDSRRIERGMTWAAVARAVNRADERRGGHPVSASTISGLKNKRWGIEGDGALQMLLWLDRTPESFVPGHPGGGHPDARLPEVSGAGILRFDVPSIFAKLDAQRAARGLTWTQVAAQVGGLYNAVSLRNMSKGQRTGFPHVMWLARWLHCPVAALTHVTPR
jgi:hypothetical protein